MKRPGGGDPLQSARVLETYFRLPNRAEQENSKADVGRRNLSQAEGAGRGPRLEGLTLRVGNRRQ